MHVLLIPCEGSPRTLEIDGGLESLQDLVGGYIEPVPVPGHDDALALVNEDGLRLRLPPNIAAGDLLRRDVVGDVVICGRGGEKFTDAPNGLLAGF